MEKVQRIEAPATVLISGSGVAGAALAFWLREQGLTPVVVERAPALRRGGQAVDVRGAALTVLRRMGLEAPARALRNESQGMNMLDADGNELMRSEEFALSSGRLETEDIELLREDLVELVHERLEGVEYVYGDSITAIDEDAEGVQVEFENAAPRRFALVVGADGLHSNTRRLVFGPEAAYIHHLGTYLSVFSQENYLGMDRWQTWINNGTDGGAVMTVRDNKELRIFLGFAADPIDYDYRDVEAQKRLVAEHVAGFGWEVPNLVERMWTAEDFYFDSMAQIKMESWSRGRTVLLGDAAHCAAPLSGQGTSLALVGAYVLAVELGRATDHAEAFVGYEKRMRTFVEANQELALIDRRTVDPDESTRRLDAVKNLIDLDAIG
ncbi:FAD-dependent monooxygenase [Nocardioides albus]|uniref:2-polyprenyl-6-methoxyphenol hydroxylase-like FAD-dependent oxidoreductase n=1 Tax=Nocardioides albus TaxID=1841 RepID=A0A7W5FB30_9ACTN|nr:FAD-dependent monooxygenase [Nocardioides albus]MBB3091929.1 2-polyprenyl-6-methoxyphenol hydroxylase-like FAD-dependent oxidoreductase [Nocardioides albus]